MGAPWPRVQGNGVVSANGGFCLPLTRAHRHRRPARHYQGDEPDISGAGHALQVVPISRPQRLLCWGFRVFMPPFEGWKALPICRSVPTGGSSGVGIAGPAAKPSRPG